MDFLIKLKEIFPEYNYDWIILGKKPITTNDSSLFNKETNTVEINQFVGNEDVNNDNEVVLLQKNEVNDSRFDPQIDKLPTESPSNRIKQIIYVYEDRTFEVYDVRK